MTQTPCGGTASGLLKTVDEKQIPRTFSPRQRGYERLGMTRSRVFAARAHDS